MKKLDIQITNQLLSQKDFDSTSNLNYKKLLKGSQHLLPIKNSYCRILQNSAQFLEECYAPNYIYHLSFLFQYMLYHGFFSMDCEKFRYQDYGAMFRGMMVMEGYGNCQHITSFYQNVFSLLLSKYSAQVFEIYSYLPNEEEIIDRNSPENFSSNHVLNCIISGTQIYLYDALNKDFVIPDVFSETSCAFFSHFGMNQDDIILYPDSLVFGNKSFHLLKAIHCMSKPLNIKKKELKDIKKEVYSDCKKNIDLLLDFYTQNKSYIDEVGNYARKKKNIPF